MEEEHKEQIKEKRKNGWIEVWFAIETLGIDKDVVDNALAKHIEKLCNVADIFVYEKSFKEIEHVKNPMKDVDEAWSQVCDLKLFAKNIPTLLNVVYLYGPSAIEILGPHRKEITIEEMQDITNTLAGLVHQFAAAGVGGIIITPDNKKH